MKVKSVGGRGLLFTFKELKESHYDCFTNVYVILGKKYSFILDTYIGPYYIKQILNYIEEKHAKKDYIVFNSHGHWDHVWGNCYFKDSLIISHYTCRDYIKTYGEEEYEINKKEFAKEDIDIILPNTTFVDKMVFEEEGLEFFYSPGHSIDSSSCYDRIDNVLFVGDNVDDPIPSYISNGNLDIYVQTLEKYLTYEAGIIVQSHGDICDNEVIRKNIEYLKDIKSNKDLVFSDNDIQNKHEYNMNYLANN